MVKKKQLSNYRTHLRLKEGFRVCFPSASSQAFKSQISTLPVSSLASRQFLFHEYLCYHCVPLELFYFIQKRLKLDWTNGTNLACMLQRILYKEYWIQENENSDSVPLSPSKTMQIFVGAW